MNHRSLAVVHASQLVTLAGPRGPRTGAQMGELSIMTDGAMLVRDGVIVRTGTQREVDPLIDAGCTLVDAGGRVVMPGFVDAHTHPVFAGNRVAEFELRAAGRTYQEIAQQGGGIRSTVCETRAASEEELFAAARRYADWFLQSGTTTIEAKSGYGLTVEDELKMLRVIRRLDIETVLRCVPTFLGAHTIPDEFARRRSSYVDLVVNDMVPRVARERLAVFCDVFCEEGAFDVEESRRILQAAQTHGLKSRIHADQFSCGGGARLAAELGAVTADHLEHADEAAIAALHSAGVQPVLLPAAVLLTGSQRYPNARSMIDAGLAVVLATDFNPGSSPTSSMPLVLTLAATQMRMLPAEAVVAATINAAYSLGLGDEIGSLEPGKRADFAIHDCDDYRDISYFAASVAPVCVCAAGSLVARRD